MSSNILVIPDAHTGIGDSVERFTALGEYIVKHKPDEIVCLGDFADMHSLSLFDSDYAKRDVVESYRKECLAVKKSLKALFAPLVQYNKRAKRQHKRRYNPNTTLTLGNHDQGRFDNMLKKHPLLLEGVIQWQDLGYEKYFKQIVEYKQGVTIEGVYFTHHAVSMLGRAIGGMIAPARQIVTHSNASIVVGHSHIYDHTVTTNIHGERIHGLVAGCFIDPDSTFNYAKGAQHAWVNGVSILHNTNEGNYDLEFLSIERLLS